MPRLVPPVSTLLFTTCLVAGTFVAAAPVTIDLATWTAPEGVRSDAASQLQAAIDSIGNNSEGGTLILKNNLVSVDRPIFVGAPRITIIGRGMNTSILRQDVHSSLLLLGIRESYPDTPIGDDHFPPVGSQEPPVLDRSVPTSFGLRTLAKGVRAAGWFPTCPFTLGAPLPKHGIIGTHYKYESTLVFDLCLANNGGGIIRGVVCGVGDKAGGLAADPVGVWTIESDADSGRNLSFRFRTVDATGREKIQHLRFSAAPVGPGVHRFSVQVDLASGTGRAWFGTSRETVVTPVLTDAQEFGTGLRFRAFDFGAFRLGRVTDQPFSGSPADPRDAASGDWTYAGVCLGVGQKYATEGGPGSEQKLAAGGTLDDHARYFTADKNTLAFLRGTRPEAAASRHLVPMKFGGEIGRDQFHGFWLPARPASTFRPGDGVTVESLGLQCSATWGGAGIVIGEVARVTLRDLAAVTSAAYGLDDWGCHAPNLPVEINHVAIEGYDTMYYGKSQDIDLRFWNGRPSWTGFRFVGCRGSVRYALFGDSDRTETAYIMLHAGPFGGPLTISNICFDNEGYENPWKNGALFYAEPSWNPGPEGNLLTISAIYNGTMYAKLDQSLIILADAPGEGGPKPVGRLSMRLVISPAHDNQYPHSLIRCATPNWYGRLEGVQSKGMPLTYGPIFYTGPEGTCNVQTVQQDSNWLTSEDLPTKGTWLAGRHLIRVADPRLDPARTATWSCTRTGTYGTETPPEWKLVTDR
jgi:hypothetical protein